MRDNIERRIERGLNQLAEEPVETHLYHQMTAGLRNARVRETRMKSNAFKGVIAGAIVAAAVAALLLIPAAYTVTVGSVAKVSFLDDGAIKPMEVVMALSIPKTQKVMTIDHDRAEITIAARKVGPDELKTAVTNALKPMESRISELKIAVEPIREDRGGNALAALTGGRIEIGVEGLSDAVIERRIAEALSAHGMNVRSVSVSTTNPEPGRIERRVEIMADCDSLGNCEAPDIHFDDLPAGGARERVVIRKLGDAQGE